MNTTKTSLRERLRPRRPSRNTGLALLAGLLVTAGLPPFQWTGVLVPIGLMILFRTMMSDKRPALLAWYFGVAHQASTLYWLFLLVPAKSIPTRALVPLQGLAAILYVAVFYLLVGWAFEQVKRWVGRRAALLALPVLWTAMEALRSWGELGFSWCLAGSAIIGTPLMGLARASGEIGLGAGLAFWAAAGTAIWLWRTGRPCGRQPMLILGAGTIVIWTALLVGSRLTPELPDSPTAVRVRTTPLTIAAVQANVHLADKWADAKIDSTRRPYTQLTAKAAAAGADLVVWAETAVPAYVRYDQALKAWTRAQAQRNGVFVFTGFPDAERMADGQTLKYNSSGLFSPTGELLDRYAKYHLLPIGETMPFQSVFPALAKVDVGQAEWTPGQPPVPIVVPGPDGDFPFSGLICFESIFSRLARQSVLAGSRCLAVITNDGWFGETAGPRQHTALARLRAVECAVPVVRCANNGISFICDQTGRIQDELGLGQRGYILAEVMPGTGRTCYVRYGAWPLFWAMIVWFVPVLAWGFITERRNRIHG